jgi:hypothetical protein
VNAEDNDVGSAKMMKTGSVFIALCHRFYLRLLSFFYFIYFASYSTPPNSVQKEEYRSITESRELDTEMGDEAEQICETCLKDIWEGDDVQCYCGPIHQTL